MKEISPATKEDVRLGQRFRAYQGGGYATRGGIRGGLAPHHTFELSCVGLS